MFFLQTPGKNRNFLTVVLLSKYSKSIKRCSQIYSLIILETRKTFFLYTFEIVEEIFKNAV